MNLVLRDHAARILRRHYENLGGEYQSDGQRDKLIADAVSAAENTVGDWHAIKAAAEKPLYDFVRANKPPKDPRRPEHLHAVARPEPVVAPPTAPPPPQPDSAFIDAGLSKQAIDSLIGEGVYTVEDLRAWRDANGEFTQIRGVGVSAAATLEALLDESEDPEPEGGSDEGAEADGGNEAEGDPE